MDSPQTGVAGTSARFSSREEKVRMSDSLAADSTAIYQSPFEAALLGTVCLSTRFVRAFVHRQTRRMADPATVGAVR